MYAKASYRRLGCVDLDAIWHWREMQHDPYAYGLTVDETLPGAEILRGRKLENDPWCHHPGDEWLAANPVEVPGLSDTLANCSVTPKIDSKLQSASAYLFALPAELVDHVLSFLGQRDLIAAAGTCHLLRFHAQPLFKAYTIQDLSWFWELFEGEAYPTSPDWPATWDPCNPPGLDVPELPLGLATAEEEKEICNQVIEDHPELIGVGNAVRTLNFLRREIILNPYRTKIEWSLREWDTFRADVTDWIRRPASSSHSDEGTLDWIRLWHSLHPSTTLYPGIRNRARIWKDCNRILDHRSRMREQGIWEAKQKIVQEVISYNRMEWWEREKEAMQDVSHTGFLRKQGWEY